MYVFESYIRVRYAETDQMGYVYYGNYPMYFEVARVEMLRSLGFTYKRFEEDGIMLPVIDMHIKYIKPALYDDLLKVKIIVAKLPTSRVYFETEIYNEANELLNKAEVTLVCIDTVTRRICKPPQDFIQAIEHYFKP